MVLCHCAYCRLLQPIYCLSVTLRLPPVSFVSLCLLLVPPNIRSVGSLSLCSLLSSIVCPVLVFSTHFTVYCFCFTVSTAVFCSLFAVLSYRVSTISTSQCTVSWFCVTMPNAVLYSLSTVCQYLSMFRLLLLCQCVHCGLLQSLNCLSVPHNVPSVFPVCLCPLLSSTASSTSFSTSQYAVCSFFVTMSTVVFYNLSTVCQYATLYRNLILCHYFHWFLLVCPLSVSTSHSTVCWSSVTVSTLVFYIISTGCQYLTL